MRSSVHVCLCADANVIPYACVVVASAAHYTPDADIHVHLVHPFDLPDAEGWRQRLLVAGASTARMYPARWSRAGYRGLSHVSETTMLRLLLPSLLTDVQRVLYLDTDTLVCASLLPLLAHTQTGRWGLAIKSSIHPSWRVRDGARAGNAGVIVWDLHVSRGCQFQERCMRALDAAPALHDQDVLNNAMAGAYGDLPPHANVFVNQDHLAQPAYTIFHFAGGVKPWDAGAAARLPRQALALWRAFAQAAGVVLPPLPPAAVPLPLRANEIHPELDRLAVDAEGVGERPPQRVKRAVRVDAQ